VTESLFERITCKAYRLLFLLFCILIDLHLSFNTIFKYDHNLHMYISLVQTASASRSRACFRSNRWQCQRLPRLERGPALPAVSVGVGETDAGRRHGIGAGAGLHRRRRHLEIPVGQSQPLEVRSELRVFHGGSEHHPSGSTLEHLQEPPASGHETTQSARPYPDHSLQSKSWYNTLVDK